MTDEIPPEQTQIDVYRENDHADRTQLIAIEAVDEWSTERPSLSEADWHLLRSKRFQAGWSPEAIKTASQDWIVQQLVEDAYRLGLSRNGGNS